MPTNEELGFDPQALRSKCDVERDKRLRPDGPSTGKWRVNSSTNFIGSALEQVHVPSFGGFDCLIWRR
jgi:hypothetical protein